MVSGGRIVVPGAERWRTEAMDISRSDRGGWERLVCGLVWTTRLLVLSYCRGRSHTASQEREGGAAPLCRRQWIQHRGQTYCIRALLSFSAAIC